MYYGCALLISNIVSHNHKVNYNTLKTYHINSNVVNITIPHRYSYFTPRYYVSVMKQRGVALWRLCRPWTLSQRHMVIVCLYRI